MAILTADKINTVKIGGETLTINEKIIPDGARATKYIAGHIPQGGLVKPNKKLGLGNTGFPQGVTIHNTEVIQTSAGTNPAEQYTRATYPNGNMGGVVVHFYIYKREIWQNLYLDEQGWHAADGATRRTSQRQGKMIGGNLDTIAIEVVGNDPETEKTAGLLTAWLCSLYGFDPNFDVYTHKYFYSAKNCPIWLIPRWEGFISNIAGYLGAGSAPVSPTAPITPPTATGTVFRVQTGAFNDKSNAVKLETELKAKGFETILKEIDYVFKVQVGAFSVRENADAMLAKLKAAGYEGFISTDGLKTVPSAPPTTPAPAPPIKSVEQVAQEIWNGKGGWGFDPGRKEKLISYGGVEFRNAVQKRVNEILAGK